MLLLILQINEEGRDLKYFISNGLNLEKKILNINF
jgi:hypothetical protein